MPVFRYAIEMIQVASRFLQLCQPPPVHSQINGSFALVLRKLRVSFAGQILQVPLLFSGARDRLGRAPSRVLFVRLCLSAGAEIVPGTLHC